MKIFFRRIHLYLSFAAGLVILTACATGALLVFQKELEQAFYHGRYFTNPGAVRLSADTLVARVRSLEPGAQVNSIRIYTDARRNAEIGITPKMKDQPKAGALRPQEGRGPGITIFIDPYTGQIKDRYNARHSFFFQVMALHRWLLGSNDGPGKYITGVATFIFVFILITGIILWWPRTRRILYQRIRLRRGAGWKRLNHDLHLVLGFYTAIFLFIFAFTALPMSFQWFNKGIYTVTRSPLKNPEPPRSIPIAGSTAISLDMALAQASTVVPSAEFYALTLPRDARSVIAVSALSKNAVHESATDAVYIDQYSGAIAGTLLYEQRSTGARVRSTFRPVHVGSIWGWPSKVIACIVCLAGVTFPVTGTIMWWNRTRGRRRKISAS